MVESTNRQYNKQQRDIEIQSQRGILESQKQQEDLQRKFQEQKTSMGRQAETMVGTENLPQLEGYSALGNVAGSMYEEKVRDIEARKQAIANELNQASLQTQLNY
jgi:hypothetical protein